MPVQMFTRWDVLNPTNVLAGLLLLWSAAVFHRPHLPDILPSYARFDDVMPWLWWGYSQVTIALLMLFTPRSSLWRLLAHALCGTMFLGISTAFSVGVGITPGFTTFTGLAIVSGFLFARTATHWASHSRWWQHLISQPPRWLRVLAQLPEEEKRGR